MSTITISVPITKEQQKFLKNRVESGTAANTAHAVRQALDMLREEELFTFLSRSKEEVRSGRILYGDLDDLAKRLK
ncbi:hypothetical protein BH11PAT3_BH11PAT3_3490 [soil metagenome]